MIAVAGVREGPPFQAGPGMRRLELDDTRAALDRAYAVELPIARAEVEWFPR